MATNGIKLIEDLRQELITEITKNLVIKNPISTFRLFDADFGIPSFESCQIIQIANNVVYYADNVQESIYSLTMEELVDIVKQLN